MGRNHIGNLNKRKDVEITFVCDPDTNHQVNAAKLVESGTGINRSRWATSGQYWRLKVWTPFS